MPTVLPFPLFGNSAKIEGSEREGQVVVFGMDSQCMEGNDNDTAHVCEFTTETET